MLHTYYRNSHLTREEAMDEYLFIELAKWQAGRRRLECDQHEQLHRFEADESRSNEGHREALHRQWFASTWSKQS
jgi:hypothetical protein